MKIPEKYKVISIDSYLCKEWLLKKHYAKRLCSISYSFGLYCKDDLVGVLTIGKPASNTLCVGICGKEFTEYVYELNRLCVNEGLEKNVLSYFVASSIKLINCNMILVSYADTKMSHHGYIYQATNWIYTGKTKERTDIGNDENKHGRHYDKNTDYSKNRKIRSSKHRYVYFIGKMKKTFKENLNYNVEPYPKGNNLRYDASYTPLIQKTLFI